MGFRQQPKQEEQEKRDPPVWSKRYHSAGGFIEVAVFSQMREGNGQQFRTFATSIKRSYKDDKGWKESKSYRPEDLLVISAACQEAFSVITNEQERK